MQRRNVSQLGHQESVDQVFSRRRSSCGPIATATCTCKSNCPIVSGSLSARMWNASEADHRGFDDGDFVRVEGTTQIYQGALQLIATSICRARPEEVELADFMTLSPAEIDQLAVRLASCLRELARSAFAQSGRVFFGRRRFHGRFTRSPAGVKNHHAYPGGLLEHVVNLMEVAVRIADRYPTVDFDLVVIGRVPARHGQDRRTQLRDRGFSYTDAGQMLGHVVLAVGHARRQAAPGRGAFGRRISAEELALRLKHMIISHHGQYEFGSPKLPMTLEAITLHRLDNLDAKIHHFQQLIRDDANQDSPWTQFHQNLNRKLFKGSARRRAAQSPDRSADSELSNFAALAPRRDRVITRAIGT